MMKSEVVLHSQMVAIANVLLRHGNRSRDFHDGVRALAEACGVEPSALAAVTDVDVELLLEGVHVE